MGEIDGGFTLVARTEPEQRLIELLAEGEDRRRGRPTGQAFRGESMNPLTAYQIEYARKLYRQGVPLRTIGMLFQLAPAELWSHLNLASKVSHL